MSKLILASASPRRKELLKQIVSDFTVVPPNIDEIIDLSVPIEEAIEKLSLNKAQAVASQYPEATIIAADSIVYFKGQVLGKPKNRQHAHNMLKQLSGQEHRVITGVTVLNHKGRTISFSDSVRVKFKAISDDKLKAYLNTKEPYDKAGAYAIQGKGKAFVEYYNGEFETVVGLPTNKIKLVLNS
jgi:septum formation protein